MAGLDHEKAPLVEVSDSHRNQRAPRRRNYQRRRESCCARTLGWLLIFGCLALLPFYANEGYWRGTDFTVYEGESLQWKHCGRSGQRDLECASLEVPMDQFNPATPGNKTFTIPIIRLRGKNATQGQNLLLNPGGPGGSGVDYLRKVGEQLNIMVGEGYHLVSFDPRGVGGSRPQGLCYPDAETRKQHDSYRNRDIVQDSPDVYVWASNFAQACAETTGEHGAYINTPQTAADMNSILDALHQEKLAYWGISYGTLLGQTYAMMYPDRVGKMIIDGVANVFEYYISEPRLEMMTDTGRCFEGFFEECVKAGEACPLNKLSLSATDLYEKVVEFSEPLKNQPMSVYLNSTHYGALDWKTMWLTGIFESLYMPSAWYRLADRLHKLLQGDATDFFLDHGVRSRAMAGNDAFNFIMNNDGLTGPTHWPQDREVLLRLILPKLRSSPFAPLTNERFYMKQQWRIPRTHNFDPVKAADQDLPPLLILSQSYDPVTPMICAMSARNAFPQSRLVEIEGYGHCSVASPSQCSIEHVRRFLYEGRLPREDVKCVVDDPFFTAPGEVNHTISRDILEDADRYRLYKAQKDFVVNLFG